MYARTKSQQNVGKNMCNSCVFVENVVSMLGHKGFSFLFFLYEYHVKFHNLLYSHKKSAN
jgi:hypothetical protein